MADIFGSSALAPRDNETFQIKNFVRSQFDLTTTKGREAVGEILNKIISAVGTGQTRPTDSSLEVELQTETAQSTNTHRYAFSFTDRQLEDLNKQYLYPFDILTLLDTLNTLLYQSTQSNEQRGLPPEFRNGLPPSTTGQKIIQQKQNAEADVDLEKIENYAKSLLPVLEYLETFLQENSPFTPLDVVEQAIKNNEKTLTEWWQEYIKPAFDNLSKTGPNNQVVYFDEAPFQEFGISQRILHIYNLKKLFNVFIIYAGEVCRKTNREYANKAKENEDFTNPFASEQALLRAFQLKKPRDLLFDESIFLQSDDPQNADQVAELIIKLVAILNKDDESEILRKIKDTKDPADENVTDTAGGDGSEDDADENTDDQQEDTEDQQQSEPLAETISAEDFWQELTQQRIFQNAVFAAVANEIGITSPFELRASVAGPYIQNAPWFRRAFNTTLQSENRDSFTSEGLIFTEKLNPRDEALQNRFAQSLFSETQSLAEEFWRLYVDLGDGFITEPKLPEEPDDDTQPPEDEPEQPAQTTEPPTDQQAPDWRSSAGMPVGFNFDDIQPTLQLSNPTQAPQQYQSFIERWTQLSVSDRIRLAQEAQRIRQTTAGFSGNYEENDFAYSVLIPLTLNQQNANWQTIPGFNRYVREKYSSLDFFRDLALFTASPSGASINNTQFTDEITNFSHTISQKIDVFESQYFDLFLRYNQTQNEQDRRAILNQLTSNQTYQSWIRDHQASRLRDLRQELRLYGFDPNVVSVENFENMVLTLSLTTDPYAFIQSLDATTIDQYYFGQNNIFKPGDIQSFKEFLIEYYQVLLLDTNRFIRPFFLPEQLTTEDQVFVKKLIVSNGLSTAMMAVAPTSLDENAKSVFSQQDGFSQEEADNIREALIKEIIRQYQLTELDVKATGDFARETTLWQVADSYRRRAISHYRPRNDTDTDPYFPSPVSTLNNAFDRIKNLTKKAKAVANKTGASKLIKAGLWERLKKQAQKSLIPWLVKGVSTIAAALFSGPGLLIAGLAGGALYLLTGSAGLAGLVGGGILGAQKFFGGLANSFKGLFSGAGSSQIVTNAVAVGKVALPATIAAGGTFFMFQNDPIWLALNRPLLQTPDSKYVTVTKRAVDVNTDEYKTDYENGSFPGTALYEITIEPRQNYTINITEMRDTVSLNKKEDNDAVAGTVDLSGRVNEGIDPIGPGSSYTFRYEVPIQGNMQSFADTAILNNFEVLFDVSSPDGLNELNQIARDRETICIGDCPVLNCWPTAGAITQEPHGREYCRGKDYEGTDFSHCNPYTSDAYDIGQNVNRPIDNDPVVSATSGVVTNAEFASDYGNYVQVAEAGTTYIYAHLRQINVSVGDQVSVGDLIGFKGNTGNSGGMHLHFEIRPILSRNAPNDASQLRNAYDFAQQGKTITETEMCQ